MVSFFFFISHADPRAIGREIKRTLLGKLLQREAFTSMAPMETKHTAGGVDLGLVIDEIYLSQDFGLWFGKSVFEGILAEILQKEHSGHTAVTLVDVLELMLVVYCPDVTGAPKKPITPQQTHEAFYRFIHNRRCDTSDEDWEIFRHHLACDIATSCGRLRGGNVLELQGISLSTLSKTSMVHTPTIDASNGAYFPSSTSSSSTRSSVSSHQQHLAESLPETNETAQSPPLANPAPAPRVAVEMPRYTSVLNEHAALQGEKLTYEKKQLTVSPSCWQCTATFGTISRVGTGRNGTQAKHEASKKICEHIDLIVL